MSNLKTLFAVALLLGTFAAPAFANDRDEVMEGVITTITPSGMKQTVIRDTAELDQIISHGHQIDAHSMIVSHNGKLYLASDFKMPNGMMLSQEIDDMIKGTGK